MDTAESTKRLSGLLLALLAVAAVAMVPPPAAEAYTKHGEPWPNEVITYSTTTSGYAASVDRAAALLNRAHDGPKFRRTSAGDAEVVFLNGGTACNGSAFLGYQRLEESTVWLGRGCNKDLITLTAVHEMIHVLGLDHERRVCARMNVTFDRSGSPDRCPLRSIAYWLAHPLTPDDERGLKAIYSRRSTHSSPPSTQ